LILILFPTTYPYGAGEQTFLGPEIEHLASNFDRVIIVPETLGGKKHAVPAGVEVEESYALINRSDSQETKALSRKINMLSRALFSRLFYEDLVARPSILFRPLALRRLVGFIHRAELTRKWVGNFIENKKLDPSQCILYTYWFVQSSLGIGLAKRDYPQIRLISRVHGYDLYEERHNPAYIPCRPSSLRTLDRLFPASEAGRKYIVTRYPWFAPRCETSRLGVRDPGFITSTSPDGVLRIVSCSFVIPLKRVDLLLKGIARASELRPEQQFEWHHFGEGPLKSDVEEMARRELPVNVKSYFPGYPSLEHLMLFYKNNPVDLFMNVSTTEGGAPVSIMEAISCGVPVLATAVGGNPEIVSDQNGKLLSSNPTPDEIAESIFSILDNPDLAAEKRKGSRRVWREKYNANSNFQAFADCLKSIRRRA
jgi:glycosyltransferase involved in cell wall biosynthesis